MSDIKLGTGLATGMMYHAPVGTALPTSPATKLDAAWKEVGDVSADGISLATDKKTDLLKNWANVVKRIIMTEHSETIGAPLIDTTEETLKTVLGSGNVTATAATADHGALITANLSASTLPDPEMYLFLMKDGEDMIGIGGEGQITSVDKIAFKPGEAITWTPTITAVNDGFKLITDDGAKVGA
ncbi:MAG: hypothetical protein LKE48_02695 [Solobacterium sp.]|jgi:hypothetical protein|nr:hypothetical protein [Solobacterium sp.]